MSLFLQPAPRDFLAKERIIEHVKESNNYTPDEELGNADALIIFQESDKQIWLVFTRFRIYSIIDDVRERGPRIQWSISKSRIITKGEITLDIRIKNYTDECGFIDIGYRKDCIFNKHLYPRGDIIGKIRRLIRSTMI